MSGSPAPRAGRHKMLDGSFARRKPLLNEEGGESRRKPALCFSLRVRVVIGEAGKCSYNELRDIAT